MGAGRVRAGVAIAAAAALGAAVWGVAAGGAASAATAAGGEGSVRAASVAATSAKGCASNRTPVPRYADTSSIGDVDGDGRADRQFYDPQTLVYGIRTASGATIVLHDNLPAPNQHGGWTARTNAGVTTVIDDGATAEVFRFSGCRFVQVPTPYELPFLSTLSDGGYGPRPSDLVRYGVGCFGGTLADTIAVRGDDGRWELDRYALRAGSHGSLRQETERTVVARGLSSSDQRIQRAGSSRCGAVPKVFSDGR